MLDAFAPALTTWKIKIDINDNHMMHGSWDIKCNGQNIFFILDHFLPFYPTNSLKNQDFEKMKIPGDIILHMCT